MPGQFLVVTVVVHVLLAAALSAVHGAVPPRWRPHEAGETVGRVALHRSGRITGILIGPPAAEESWPFRTGRPGPRGRYHPGRRARPDSGTPRLRRPARRLPHPDPQEIPPHDTP